MTQPSAPTDLDRQVLDFLQRAFDVVRSGDAAELGQMLDQGLPVNIRNQKGDTLLMLATYHGHLDATRLLLSRGADASVANDMGQTPLQAAAFRARCRWCACCSTTAPTWKAGDRRAAPP
ncbi:ankyrin repeat domain-containing protein [Deinococcus wulumuqiensis]|uniref:ankyrin repeat domain-containing protein n=1 Tax=Deinococcus wulumuqiensis TaxID=980427 RepID=UPI0035EF9072